MKRMHGTTLLASCAILSFGAAAASADCAEELAALQSGNASGAETGAPAMEEGISKDGTHAPLEGEESTTAGEDQASSASDDEIAKDGSLAPLEQSDDDASAPDDYATASTSGERSNEDAVPADSDGSEEIVKDGTTPPLGNDEEAESQDGAAAGEDPGAVAVSQQAAEAQQEQSPPGSDGNARAEALERAQAALDRGDEEACMDAVEEARTL